MSSPVDKTCERCSAAMAVRGERYCKGCRKAVLEELEEAGALTPYPGRGFRSRDQMENVRETKFGGDHSSR